MNDPDTLTVSVRIAAPPEVFPYFVDPSLIVPWIGDSADPYPYPYPEPGGLVAVNIDNSTQAPLRLDRLPRPVAGASLATVRSPKLRIWARVVEEAAKRGPGDE